MWNENGRWREKKWRVLPDRNGLHFRLYLIFVCFAAVIVVLIGVVQFVFVSKQVREETETQLFQTARNISSTYGTTAYENAIRSVIYSGEYLVRTMTEDGKILIDADDLSVYLHWPDITFDLEEVLEQLNHSNGSFYLKQKDSENVTWIVYGQVVASWNGTRELLFLTKNTLSEIEQIRKQMFLLAKVGGIIMLLSFFFCWFIAKTYLKPIKEITDRAVMLTGGDYSITFPKESYTEINKLSATLDLAVDQFANYEQMRRDMIANLSHDMRTPLTMIKAYAEMIQTISGDNPEKRHEHLDVIISQSDKLSEFVSASLDLAALQSKSLVLDYRIFALNEMVKRTVLRFEAISQGKYQFCMDLDENCMIKADPGRMEQILNNLIHNAMKYGDGLIEVNVKHLRKKIRLEIGDNGSGIAEDKLHLVWTKYYRINPYDRDTGSTGVGLSIVKEIADLHGLSYGVDSPEGKGALFWFEFPAEKQK